jgi:phosphoribosylglycinamide formyltransferase-1
MTSSGDASVPAIKRIAIFASGAGSNAKKIIEHFCSHPFVKVEMIACNKPGAGVLKIAAANKIKILLIEKEKFFRGLGYVDELKEQCIDFIALAGFLWKIPPTLINTYRNKIINIHPALLPKYGGKGMFGPNVHEAVIAAREKESGITIHYVDERYDNGDVIFQAVCSVFEDDTAESLAQKIHELEHKYYATVIEACIAKITLKSDTSL